MNDAKINRILKQIDLVETTDVLTDLKVAFELIARNENALLKYTSLEEAYRLLSNVIVDLED